MRVWFPDYLTEAHREPYYGAELVWELHRQGIDCVLSSGDRYDAVFIAFFETAREVRNNLIENSRDRIPVIHYCWDLYPFQLIKREDTTEDYHNRWIEYTDWLRSARGIIAPSVSAAKRIGETVPDIPISVVRSSVRVFDTEVISPGEYILDPVRKYPDPNNYAVENACRDLGLPLVQSMNRLSWSEFKKTVGGCRFLVSAQYEASTGGLSTLEGYALGKPVLLSDSEYHGGRDYFGGRATYFRWDDPSDLKDKLTQLWDSPTVLDRDDCLSWVEENYSNKAMAQGIAEAIKTWLN